MIGDNGKALIFPLAELPEMPRGKGVKLQSYREGGLRDAMIFNAAEGADGSTPPAATARGPTGATSWASAPRPAAWRRAG